MQSDLVAAAPLHAGARRSWEPHLQLEHRQTPIRPRARVGDVKRVASRCDSQRRPSHESQRAVPTPQQQEQKPHGAHGSLLPHSQCDAASFKRKESSAPSPTFGREVAALLDPIPEHRVLAHKGSLVTWAMALTTCRCAATLVWPERRAAAANMRRTAPAVLQSEVGV